jgi:hypothetical protein
MSWEVEYTDQFEQWWGCLDQTEQAKIGGLVELLETKGPMLPFPFSSGIISSRHEHMRELRIQHHGRPYRVFYAFDPRRVAILLLGGVKWGDARWYESMVPKADQLYDEHLQALKKEGRCDG